MYFPSLHFRVWYWSSFAPMPFDILVTEWSTSNSFYLNVPYYHFMISRISRSFMPQEIRDWVYIHNFPLGLRASSIILSQVVGFYVTYSLFSEITPFVKHIKMHTVIFKYDMYLHEITISLFMSLIKYLSWFSILTLLKFSHSKFYLKVYILNYNLMFFHICNSILLIITIF